MISWKKGDNKTLSKYFNSKEFENKSDENYYIEKELIETLTFVREEFGSPIKITSGYRSPVYNKSIGGATNSSHCNGMAADITPEVMSKANLDRLYEICEKHFLAVGDGRKKGFIHVDIRKGKTRRWKY